MSVNFLQLANFIWSVVNLTRGPYRPPQYERVMLQLRVLRRVDAVLAFSKEAVLKRHGREPDDRSPRGSRPWHRPLACAPWEGWRRVPVFRWGPSPTPAAWAP